MKKRTRLKLLILTPLIALLLVAMTISDSYYSNLEKQYPILQVTEKTEGRVTSILTHHKYTFLELDGSKKRLIPPSFLKSTDPIHFHKIIAIGDYFVHDQQSNEVSLVKNNESLDFIVSGFSDL